MRGGAASLCNPNAFLPRTPMCGAYNGFQRAGIQGGKARRPAAINIAFTVKGILFF
jgi:hypothetical protein